MFEEINSWLNSDREFFSGLALYDRYGLSFNQKRLLRMSGPSRKNNEILLYELSKLVKGVKPSKPAAIPKAKAIIEKKKPESSQSQPQKRESWQPSGQSKEQSPEKVKSEIIDKMKIRDNLHATLEFLPTDEKRNEAAHRILDLSDEISEGYEQLDYFNKFGHFQGIIQEPAKKMVHEMDLGELMQRQHTLRTYVTRYTKRLKEAKTAQKAAENQNKLDQYKVELEDVERRLRK